MCSSPSHLSWSLLLQLTSVFTTHSVPPNLAYLHSGPCKFTHTDIGWQHIKYTDFRPCPSLYHHDNL
ncbi:hypothetical protein XELAEV_18016120mg [Xenopus laevis]|uniref:Secreted protein n=1 Tax=Xenopus laevis TaxID=8355 RepID=A0A974DJ95_XENLA|nr:hypothetical protein XELAEV_18016120mg [Xenopus laevis]